MEFTRVKAIYRKGTLRLQEPIDLPEGAEVLVQLQEVSHSVAEVNFSEDLTQTFSSYPTRPQPPESLKRLVKLVAVGGDAVADSESLYDADWH
jgi:predicted DNA-binding antitoxin AbrB/MazE fold protein